MKIRMLQYVVVGGTLPLVCDDWATVIIEPEPTPDMFQGTTTLITDLFQKRRLTVSEVSRSGLGAAMIRFQDVIERDSAVRNSPYFIGDTVMRIVEQNKGRNHRSTTFTHDVWLM